MRIVCSFSPYQVSVCDFFSICVAGWRSGGSIHLPYSFYAVGRMCCVIEGRVIVVESKVYYAHHYVFTAIAHRQSVTCLRRVGAGSFTGDVQGRAYGLIHLYIADTCCVCKRYHIFYWYFNCPYITGLGSHMCMNCIKSGLRSYSIIHFYQCAY